MVSIDKITFAVEQLDSTIAFYKNILDFEIRKIDCGDFCMYIGCIDKIQLLFCPKHIAGITSNESTLQLRFSVDNLESVIKTGLKYGGTRLSDTHEDNGYQISSLRDPDGNSIELIQKQ